jgi:hypothetical protein
MRGLLSRLRGDVGATVTEYALIVSFIVISSMGAIQVIEDGGEQRLEASDGRISAVDDAYYAGVATTTTAGSGTTTTTAPPDGVQPSSLTAAPAATNDGNKWIANATVTVTRTASPFSGVSGMVVTGDWTLPGGGSADTATCTTTSAGTCTVQRTDIQDSKDTAVFTITSITGPTYTWTPGAGDVTTVTVGCPGGAATCD